MSKLLKQPYDLYHPGVLDSYLLGLINQRSGRMDPTLTTEVTNHLFEKPGKFFGIDLAAINIQRGRDMGVPGYNHFREYCGLPRAKYFEDLTGVFSNKTLLRMSQLYKHVDDIDLWTAGISEYPIQDGIVGPTFACLIARQFVNLRRGDRFWYENSGYPAQFRIEQLDEIRKSTSARLICDNSDDVETIQASPMLIPDHYTNPRVPCHSLPAIDLSKWRDSSAGIPYGPAPYQQPQQPNHHQSYQHQPQPQHNAEQHEDYNAAYHQQANGQHGNVDVASPIVIEEEYVKPSGAGPAEAYQATGLTGEYEPLKNAQHHAFQLDHIVEAQNYRPETNIPGYPRAEKEV